MPEKSLKLLKEFDLSIECLTRSSGNQVSGTPSQTIVRVFVDVFECRHVQLGDLVCHFLFVIPIIHR